MQTRMLPTLGVATRECLTLLACLSLSLALIGCNSDSNTASSEGTLGTEMAATSSVPTVGDLQDLLDLRTEQIEPLAAALAQWQESVAVCESATGRGAGGVRGDGAHGGRRGGGHGGRGGHGGGPDGECNDRLDPAEIETGTPALVSFLAECNRILDPEQFAGLAAVLQERRTTEQRERVGRGAGQHGGRRGGCGRLIGHLPEELDPSEEQLAAWEEASTAACAALRELRQQFAAGELTAEELAEGSAAIRAELEEQLQEILTAEQYARLLEIRCERQASRATWMVERLTTAHERRLEHLTLILDLTEEQQQQIVAIFEQALPELEAVLVRVRDCEISMREARPELQEIKDATTAAIRAVLTEEQAVVFDALQELLPGHRRHGHQL